MDVDALLTLRADVEKMLVEGAAVARSDVIAKFLDEAVSAKRGKYYSAPCWLVVYLNISEYGIRQKETEAIIAEVKARYGSSFEAISVLWKGRLY